MKASLTSTTNSINPVIFCNYTLEQFSPAMEHVIQEQWVSLTAAQSSWTPSDSNQNLLKLKTFSKSLEDLTSETLYSKWKRARNRSLNQPPSAGRNLIRYRHQGQ